MLATHVRAADPHSLSKRKGEAVSRFTELGTIDIHGAVRCFYVDSGKLNNFALTPDDVRRLRTARDWIDTLLREQAAREEKAA